MYEMPLIYVFGGWGFGVRERIFCIAVLGVGILSLPVCPEIVKLDYIYQIQKKLFSKTLADRNHPTV